MKLEIGKSYKTRNGDKVTLGTTTIDGCVAFGYPYGLYLTDGRFGYMEDGRHCCACHDLDIIAEWTARHEQGTLKDIGAKHGDRVQDRNGDEADVVMHDGKLFVLYQGWLDPQPRNGHDGYCIISRASDATASPVRTVTRKEIVKGTHGKLKVCAVYPDAVTLQIGGTKFTRSELDDLLSHLTAIRDAMEDKK